MTTVYRLQGYCSDDERTVDGGEERDGQLIGRERGEMQERRKLTRLLVNLMMVTDGIQRESMDGKGEKGKKRKREGEGRKRMGRWARGGRGR